MPELLRYELFSDNDVVSAAAEAFRAQGLLPRRQEVLADKIGEVVARDLADLSAVQGALAQVEWRPVLTDMLNQVIDVKTKKLQSIPLIGSFLTLIP